jgi:DNA-directed RNA polymerase beta subunit
MKKKESPNLVTIEDLMKEVSEIEGVSGIKITPITPLERKVAPSVGQKITGRYGGKSVISQIRKKEDIPYYYDADGNKVHAEVIMNLAAIANRVTEL